MVASENLTLHAQPRDPDGTRMARRLRRGGRVPGVIYGGKGDAIPIDVDARELRHILAGAAHLIEVHVDGGETVPALVKDQQRHPVRGDAMHIDLIRVQMDVAVQTPVGVEIVGAEEAPGVKEGGVLSPVTSELNIEALPGDIPDVIHVDVSGMELNATFTLAEITPPRGVTFLDDPEETVLATITAPTPEELPEEEIETETELVGEGEAAAGEGEEAVAEAKAEGDRGEEAQQKAEGGE